MYCCIAGGCVCVCVWGGGGGVGGIRNWWGYKIVYFLSPLGVEIAAFGVR